MRTLSTAMNNRLRTNWTLLAGLVGMALWALAVSQASVLQMGANGLVTILRWPYFVGLTIVCGAFVAEVFRAKSADARLVVLVLALVTILFGSASIIEPVASITESWLHVGFISYIFHHGHILHGYDARFSWPGDFVLGAILSAFVGHANALAFARWFPVFIEALYLAPVIAIGSYSGVSRRAKWLGVSFFYATDWIYQDYFSPQAMDYFLYLVVIAAVMAMWSPGRRSYVKGQSLVATKIAQVRNALTWRRITGEQTVTNFSPTTLFSLMTLLAVIMLAVAMSHQLTPYALILALAACLATSRLGRPELVAVAVLLCVGWLSLGASDFWIGHLSTIFGGLGQVGNSIGTNVVSRVVGSPSHRFIVSARIEFTAVVFVIAGVGALRRATNSRALEFLAGAPFVIIFLQGYGGEGLLRVVLFGLPFTSLLAASALLPSRSGEVRPWIPPSGWLKLRSLKGGRLKLTWPKFRWLKGGRLRLSWLKLRWLKLGSLKPVAAARYAAVGALLLTMCVLTTMVRGGNDAYESYSLGELNAVNYVYAHVKTDQTVGVVVEYLPIGQEDVGNIYLVAVAGTNVPTLPEISSTMLYIRPDYIILSQSQEAWGEIVGGYPPGWESQLAKTILKEDYRQVATWNTAQVFQAYNQWGTPAT
jgi:hypothetical protein